jgi:DNA-binding SARP family transcriptional activator
LREEESSTPQTLGDLVRHFRRRAALTQREAARRAGMSLGGLCDVEQGRVVRPRPGTLRRLAAALELTSAETTQLIQFGRQGPVLADDLLIRVLGSLEVTVNGARVDPGSSRQRLLLGMLALSPGAAVGRDTLAETLWGAEPPPNAVSLLQSQVCRLRQRLRPAGAPGRDAEVVAATPGGYRLVAGEDQLDLLAFGRLVREARHDRENARLEPAFVAYREAIALWRGDPLADLPGLQLEPRVAELLMRRRAVVAEYADTAFALGRHDQVLPLLRHMAGTDPLDEGTHARLMLALSGAGRQAAALDVYRGLRRRLADELGVTPGPVLREAHQAILRGGAEVTDPPRRPVNPLPVPRQLPADVRGFTGRTEETAWLDATLLDDPPGDAATVAVLSGTAGVGKTALAVHWAHRVAGDFEDGQLYADLGGYGSGPAARPTEVIKGFVRALGVPDDHVPSEENERAALYRSLLADRRMLIVLDGARDSEQVRPLLPGASRSRVVVTGRGRLRGLVARDGALPRTLDRLSMAEARRLLAARLGQPRVAAHGPAVDQIVVGCAGLPLALVTVAAYAAVHPGFSLSALAGELGDSGRTLSALDACAEGPGIREVFARSYAALGAGAARLFRLLGGHPGDELDAERAAALTGVPPAQARAGLDELAAAGLVTQQAPGRYAAHRLLRLYAAELAASEEDGEENVDEDGEGNGDQERVGFLSSARST